MRKALITGGAGFIGAHLGKALAEAGFEVHLVDNLARGRRDGFLTTLLARPAVRFHQANLLENGALASMPRDFSHVFHLAAILGVRQVLEQPYATLRDNVLLLERVLEFARGQQRLERFVFASTSEVYAGSLEHLDMPVPTPEATPLALPDLSMPRTSYMLSKLYGEAMVRHAGIPFTIVRPHNFYGPRMGQSHVIPQLLEKAYRAPDGGTLEVFSVDHRRTFCFIDDAIELLVRAASRPECEGQVLNLGSESPEITIGELASIILKVVGRNLRIDARPATAGSPVRRCPDMSATFERTGYAAKVSVEEGVRRTYDWYRQMVFEGGEAEVAV